MQALPCLQTWFYDHSIIGDGRNMKQDVSRRNFIKGAALATGAGVLVSCAPKVAEPIPTTEPTAVPTVAPTSDPTPVGAKTASATVQGHGGDVTVTLTVNDGKIVDCKIVGDGETPGVGGKAVEQMPAQYIKAGNLKVDGVAGATVTTTAVKSAASMAYNEAMGISAGAVKMKPGTYTSSAMGHWGIWKLPVTITVSETALLDISVPEDRYAHGDTEVILQSVKDKLFPRMIKYQSVKVDAVAGATESSDEVKISVENALKEALVAGGSEETAIEHFYTVPEKTEKDLTEEKDVDILVLGMGAGGIMAMLSAMQTIQSINGNKLVSILGIEKAGKIGGRSCMTHEANAVNPPNYIKKFFEGKQMVNAADYKKRWLKFNTGKDGSLRCKPDLVDLFFKESGPTIDWMSEQCYIFGTPKKSEMIGGYGSFNTFATIMVDPATYEDRRKIVDSYYKKMLATVVAQGGEYMVETQAYEYLTEGDAVVGVKARNTVSGKEYIIHAKAVIQGCGGFGANEEMLNKLLKPQFAGARKNVGMGQDTGEMMQAALNIGAGTWNIDMSPNVMTIGLAHYLTLFPVNEDKTALTGRTGRYKTWTYNDIPLGMGLARESLAVDKTGKRFDNEAIIADFGKSLDTESYTSYQAGPYFLVIYSKDRIDDIAANGFSKGTSFGTYLSQGGVPTEKPMPDTQKAVDQCVVEGMAWKGETVEELAKALEMDPVVLSKTIEDYNHYCDTGVDEQFGKDPAFLKKLAQGPFYAIQLMNAPFSTVGGLDVDTQIRVLKQDHETPIPGLYAIGTDSVGVLLNDEHNYNGFGGVAMGWYNMSGRLAGANAAQYVSDTYGLKEVTGILQPPTA
jgi:fumarate reductase flavoprotein subunit